MLTVWERCSCRLRRRRAAAGGRRTRREHRPGGPRPGPGGSAEPAAPPQAVPARCSRCGSDAHATCADPVLLRGVGAHAVSIVRVGLAPVSAALLNPRHLPTPCQHDAHGVGAMLTVWERCSCHLRRPRAAAGGRRTRREHPPILPTGSSALRGPGEVLERTIVSEVTCAHCIHDRADGAGGPGDKQPVAGDHRSQLCRQSDSSTRTLA